MNALLSVTYLYGILLMIASWVLSRQYKKKFLLYLGLVLGLLLMASMQYFVASNFNKCIGIKDRFNMFGLDMVLYITLVIMVVNLIQWFVHKKIWPSLVLLVLGAVQLLAYFLLKNHFTLAQGS
ncbi:MAG: hypothetical protein SFY70_13620 [Bacteroidia bacterium]|nr:hypothetical protein [Bacteroidia bacterium]